MFDFLAYMQVIAETLRSIGHTDVNKHFYKVSGLANLEEILFNMGNGGYPALVVEDSPEGSLIDNDSTNLLDRKYYSFYVLKPANIADMESRKQAINDCKAIVNSILSLMFRQKLSDSRAFPSVYGLSGLERENITYRSVGPLGDNCFGIWVTFTLLEPAGITYSAADWYE